MRSLLPTVCIYYENSLNSLTEQCLVLATVALQFPVLIAIALYNLSCERSVLGLSCVMHMMHDVMS